MSTTAVFLLSIYQSSLNLDTVETGSSRQVPARLSPTDAAYQGQRLSPKEAVIRKTYRRIR